VIANKWLNGNTEVIRDIEPHLLTSRALANYSNSNFQGFSI